jgi:hypothetical protein
MLLTWWPQYQLSLESYSWEFSLDDYNMQSSNYHGRKSDTVNFLTEDTGTGTSILPLRYFM